MKRRQFLELAGAAAAIDVGALADRNGSTLLLDPDGTRYRAALDRVPAPPADGDGLPAVTLSVGPEESYLTDPELLGDVAVHAGIFAPDAMVAVGVGGPSPDRVRELLDARGLDPVGRVDGRPLWGRWQGRRFRAVVADDAAVHVGVGSDPGAVERWLSGSVLAGPGPPAGHPAVGDALDLLGAVSVASVDPRRRPGVANLQRDGRPPVVTARGIAVRAETALVREVRVYGTREEALAASPRREWSWTTSIGSLSAPSSRREGQAVVAEAVADADPLLDGAIGGP